MKKTIQQLLSFLVCANTASFLLLAWFHQLSNDPKSAIFIDFWGRFTVYSLWFIGYAVYRTYLHDLTFLRRLVLLIVCCNIPVFLLLAYFDKISNDPESLVFIDFWGRITVYSLWFICYELYRKYIQAEEPRARLRA